MRISIRNGETIQNVNARGTLNPSRLRGNPYAQGYPYEKSSTLRLDLGVEYC